MPVFPTHPNYTQIDEQFTSEKSQPKMKRHRYHLTPHAKDETIPLRTGVIPRGNKVFLDEIERDDDGTAQQTKGQRDAGRYHILANVWLSEFGEEIGRAHV